MICCIRSFWGYQPPLRNAQSSVIALNVSLMPFLSLIGSIVASFFCFSQSPTLAQVGLSPLIIETQAKQGQAKGYITVNNPTSIPFRARVYTRPFTYGDRGLETLSASPADLTPYLQFSPRELIVPPGVSRRVRLYVILPPNLQDGEYRAVLFTENLQTATSTDQKGFSVSVTSRIGVPIYVRKGTLTSTLAVEKATVTPQHDQILLTLKNTGQSTVRPTAEWSLKQGNTLIRSGNSTIATVITNTQRTLLLNNEAETRKPKISPDSKRTSLASAPSLPVKQPQPIPPGLYELKGKLTWSKDNQLQSQPFDFTLTIPSPPTLPTKP